MEKNKLNPFKKPLSRKLLILFGKIVVPLFFDLEKEGQEKVPQDEPLIIVGNHEGALDAVLMATYVPRDVEMLAGDEFPQETIVNIAKALYGVIPVKRMFMDKLGLKQSLKILQNGGVIGVFPEGGVWKAGNMEPKLGAAWLSYYSRASVLPIAFSGSKAAWHKATHGQRPKLLMKYGDPIPPVEKVPEKNKKETLKNYSYKIWDVIDDLLPEKQEKISDVKFDLYVYLQDEEGKERKIPEHLQLMNKSYLGQFLHNPGVIKLFFINLELPVEVFKNLEEFHSAEKFYKASRAALNYLENDNSYLLMYRFGIEVGLGMKKALQELEKLAKWAMNKNLKLKLTPIHEYYLPEKHQKVIKTTQDDFGKWI